MTDPWDEKVYLPTFGQNLFLVGGWNHQPQLEKYAQDRQIGKKTLP